ncbi:MAG: 16S rRNA (cytidine(1402)-2'-O)-methyltransferase [bacterium]
MAILYIVGTPIGNLEDISLRALRILGEADFILCEDTRVTAKLLARYGIKTPAISYHQHSDANKEKRIIDLLASGKNLALVSDAGTPGISDPGGKLAGAVIEKFGDNVKIESIPGPSAITAALSISGMPADKFIFMGFPPHKKGRQTFVKKIADSEYTAVAYESKHRIIKFLEELEKVLNPGARIVVCRELSKMHEAVYRGEIGEVIKKLKENKNNQKGEFVVIVDK